MTHKVVRFVARCPICFDIITFAENDYYSFHWYAASLEYGDWLRCVNYHIDKESGRLLLPAGRLFLMECDNITAMSAREGYIKRRTHSTFGGEFRLYKRKGK